MVISINSHILKNYGINVTSIRKLKEGVINENYLLGANGKNYLFKRYLRRNNKEITYEVEILKILENSKFSSPKIISAMDGKLLCEFNNKPAMLLKFIPGKIAKRLSIQELVKTGQLMGEMHVLLFNYKKKIIKNEELSPSPVNLKKYLSTKRNKIIKSGFSGAIKFVDFIETEFKNLSLPKNLPAGIIHNDIKSSNIIKAGRLTSVIDFDNVGRGQFLIDVATTLIWSCYSKTGKPEIARMRAFIKGYTKFRPFTKKEKQHLHDILLFRLLRESYVWPMRENTKISRRVSKYFVSAYNCTKINKKISTLCN